MKAFRWLKNRLRSHIAVIGFSILAIGQIIGFHTLIDEREAREKASCRRAILIRDEQEETWVSIIERLSPDPNDPRALEAIDAVRQLYDSLPAPSGC